MSETKTAFITLVQITCGKCGVVFGLSEDFNQKRREDHETFYCPNGHSIYYAGETEAERLKKQLANAQKRLEWAEQGQRQADERARHADERAAREKRSAASYRGKLTHVKNRVAAGCCPCCRRNFQNLQRHMATQHPAYGKEKEDG